MEDRIIGFLRGDRYVYTIGINEDNMRGIFLTEETNNESKHIDYIEFQNDAKIYCLINCLRKLLTDYDFNKDEINVKG